MKGSSDNKLTLEQAIQIYSESSNNAVNLQTIENIFKACSADNGTNSSPDRELLAKEAVQIALDNLLCMNF